MKRYNVPRIAFVNKCDRSGADPLKVCGQLRDKLAHNSVMLQLPIGLEDQHEGHIDLVKMKARYFAGDNGEDITEVDIPAEMMEQAEEYREIMLDIVSMHDDDLMEAMLMEDVTETVLNECNSKGNHRARDYVPVFCGSAYKNVGVQALLDGVVAYLHRSRVRSRTRRFGPG